MSRTLLLTHSLTNKKEPFEALNLEKVSLYVCGITPYDYSHIGHGRCYVSFDVLARLLVFLGYSVTYCRNFTDIDDKLLAKALKEKGSEDRYPEIAKQFIDAYHEDMNRLGCISPTYEPRVTDHIPEIINFIQGLIEKEYAYAVNGSVYFAIKKYPAYGELGKRRLDDLRVGARVAINEDKRDPLDFALWKAEEDGKFWQGPWGWGRPGWHIECSVLAYRYLGKSIDIHGGGMDLIFPHHENERAQSEGLFAETFVRTWMHNAFVRINQEKMSKSLNNFFTLRDLFERFDPMVVRYYYVIHHYRNPLDFSWDDLATAEKGYRRLCEIVKPLPDESFLLDRPLDLVITQLDPEHQVILNEMIRLISDDLNTQGMLGVVFEHAATIAANRTLAQCIRTFIFTVVGLSLEMLPEKEVEITPEITQLLQAREQARAERNWGLSDELREKLRILGVEVNDKKV